MISKSCTQSANGAIQSVSRTDAGREFYVDGAAVLKARLLNDVLLNGS